MSTQVEKIESPVMFTIVNKSTERKGEDEDSREGITEWGDKYKEAIELFDKDYDTVTKYKSIAQKYDSCRRRQNLSFKHHEEIVTGRGEDAGSNRNCTRSHTTMGGVVYYSKHKYL